MSDQERYEQHVQMEREAHTTTPNRESLLPCPFCGSLDVFVERATYVDCYVQCNNCSAQGPVECQDGDDEETPGEDAAKRAWNRRAAERTL